ncbi:MAG: DNRLRE domain-containing protein [Chloroflexota bacterium]|nr:DNRLRE domain-containing protein [Chloroflexota bacterium]
MKQKLMVKYAFVSILLVAAALYFVVLPSDGVSAGPPEPTSGLARDIGTRLQPYQSPAAESSQPDGCLLEKAPSSFGAEEHPLGVLDQQTWDASADAMVLEGYSSTNYKDKGYMWAGYDMHEDPDGKIARSLVKFDEEEISRDRDIAEARLRVRLVSSWGYPDTSHTVRTYCITSTWAEDDVTWDNQPGYGESYGSRSIVHGAWGWYEFDVTDLVRDWRDEVRENHGIMLRVQDETSIGWRGFGTKESLYPPQLVIEYEVSVPQVYTITPDSAPGDGIVHITDLAGDNFQDGANVKLTLGENDVIRATNIVRVSDTQITCDFDLTGAAAGAWDVVVTNPDGHSGTLPHRFYVLPPILEEHRVYLPTILNGAVPLPPFLVYLPTILN